MIQKPLIEQFLLFMIKKPKILEYPTIVGFLLTEMLQTNWVSSLRIVEQHGILHNISFCLDGNSEIHFSIHTSFVLFIAFFHLIVVIKRVAH